MARSSHTPQRPSGFTLIEMMVVVAIMGIITAMGFAGYEAMIRSGAAQNAVHDLQALIGRARATALEKNTDVWLIVYPEIKADGTAGGSGAYFLYEDGNSNFDQVVTGELGFSGFDPPSSTTPSTTDDRLLDAVYLDRSARGMIKFGVGGARFSAPFASSATDGLNSAGAALACTFCSGAGADRRGAMVFRPDGSVGFVESDGSAPDFDVDSHSTMGRSGAIGLVATDRSGAYDGKRSYLFGVAGPTGYVRVVSE